MRLGQRHIPLLSKYLMTIFLSSTATVAAVGQSKTAVSSFSSVANLNSSPSIRPLTIGDKVPDIVFENVLNYKSKQARLSDFKGKLVILDMWSVYCTSCIAAFPKMEALQKEFGDKIQILLVNPHDPKYDSEERIKLTITRNKTRTGFYPTLPIPIHDSIINTYFPHKAVPHIVLIDTAGKVLNITGTNFLTKDTLQAILNGRPIALPFKDDWAFSNEAAQTEKELKENDNILYRSQFTGYKLGKPTVRTMVTKNNEIFGFHLSNNSLQEFIRNAYSDFIGNIPTNRTILRVKNPDQYNPNPDYHYRYCYELHISPTPRKTFNPDRYLKEDLKTFFNISVNKKRQKTEVLQMRNNSKVKDLSTKYNITDLDVEANTIKKYLHNYSIKEVFSFLESYIKVPLINKMHSNIHIDLDFPDNFNLSDTAALLQFLESKGFIFIKKSKKIEFLVISDY